MMHFVLTLAVGLAVGYLLYRLRIPGGMMVGAILGVAILGVGFEAAAMPYSAKLLAQITAGAYIGTTVERGDVKRLPRIVKPALLILGMYLLFNVAMGLLIYRLSALDKTTAFFCAVPGGISDIPLIAADLGASPSKVAVVQFVRLVVGIGVFPSMINLYCSRRGGEEAAASRGERAVSADRRPAVFALTFGVALLSGLAGNRLGIPAGTLIGALIGVVVLKLSSGKSYLPMWCKRLAQALSGAYIGSTMTMQDILEIRLLAVPILVIVAGYTANCFAMGYLLYRFCGMTRKEGMLAATPAGASDMALISMDVGVQSADLLVLQVIRLVVVVSVFPPILSLVLQGVP